MRRLIMFFTIRGCHFRNNVVRCFLDLIRVWHRLAMARCSVSVEFRIRSLSLAVLIKLVSTASDEGPGLDDVELPAQVEPLDVLIFASKQAPDPLGRVGKTSRHVVS